jgi:segregation and condensation protein A
MPDYEVDLPIFHGPLDLLLYLVKRDELDLLDIPIARVAEQFLQYLDVLQVIDVEQAGEFLVMAATLMELKSKVLLPRADEAGGAQEDPRQELVRQLLEYKRFKEAAALLEQQAEKQASRFPRTPPPPPTPSGPAPLRPVELWDLVSAFGRLLRETLALQPQQITADPTPLHVYMEEVTARLGSGERARFSELFRPPHTRSRLVGYFLAILELTRRFRLQAEQDESFGDIWLRLLPGESPGGAGLQPAEESGRLQTGPTEESEVET